MGGHLDVSRVLGHFAPRFDIESRLGAGAHASVFRVYDRARRARVALKVPHEFDARALLALKDEFRSLAAVSHPNVVAFHELFVSGDAWFFTMQLVRGVDVLTHVQSVGRGAVRDVLAGLSAGLEALHAQGIVHRDLKPPNAWIDGQGVPVLLDFGLALSGADPGLRASRAGTPAYFAPELLRDRSPSPASDVYSLGVMAFEMLAGRRPFEGSAHAVLAKKLMERAPRLADLAPDVSPELADLVDRMLDPRPGQRPTAAEARRLLSGGAHVSTSAARRAALPDRDALAEQLADGLAGAQHGRPVVRFVRGPAGIGKSTLVERALVAARARDPDMLVLRGRCSEHETVPFATIDAVLDQLAARLARDEALRTELDDVASVARLVEVFPVFATVTALLDDAPEVAPYASDPRERLRQVTDALTSVLQQLGRARTVVIAIDDLQWADEDGARLLSDVISGLGIARIALLLTHRDEGRSSAPLARLAALGERGGVDVLTVSVPPLSEGDADALATALGAPTQRRERLLKESGGSPFLLETLIAGGLDALEEGAGGEQLARAAVARRLAMLPAADRALLESVCVAGHAVPVDVAARASGLPTDVGSVRALAVARLVRSRPASDGAAELEAYHDRLREIVSAGLGVERRKRLHAALATVLEQRPETDPMWVCVHLEGAGELERAASFAESGARRASRSLAFTRAAELFRFALAHRRGDDRTPELQVALGDALANAGRGHEAARAYLDASVHPRPTPWRIDLRRRAAEQQLRSGSFAEGTALLDAVLEETGVRVRATPRAALVSLMRNRWWLRKNGLRASARPKDDPAEIRRIDACFSGAVGLSVVDSIRSADLMTDALRRSLAIGDRRRLAASLGWYAAFLANGGAPAEPSTRAVLAEALALNDADGDPYARGCYEAATALTEFHLGHLSLALAACERAATIFSRETIGATKELSTVHTFELAALALEGRLAELSRRTDELVRVSESCGERYVLSNYRQGLMILRWLAADDPEGARRDLHLALEGFGARGFVVQHWFDLWGRVTVELYEGRPEAARALYVATRGRVLRSLLVRTQWTRAHTLVLDASTAIACIGRRPRSARLVSWARLVIAQLARERRPWCTALAHALGACLVAAMGDRARARRELAAAIPELDRAELGLYAMSAHTLLASEPGHAVERDRSALREGIRRPDRLAGALLPGFDAVL